MYLPQAHDLSAAIADWERLEGTPLASVSSGSQTLGVNVARSWDGRRRIVYLINYGDAPVADVRVTLNSHLSAKTARLHAPGRKDMELPWTSGCDGTSVHVPPLDLFAVLEVE